MTEKEAQDFIDKVKGKKIRWTGWSKSDYVIPDGTFSFGYFGSIRLDGSYRSGLMISCGFKTPIYGLNRWEFYEEGVIKQEEILTKVGCICSSQDLFNFGCKCGYLEE